MTQVKWSLKGHLRSPKIRCISLPIKDLQEREQGSSLSSLWCYADLTLDPSGEPLGGLLSVIGPT